MLRQLKGHVSTADVMAVAIRLHLKYRSAESERALLASLRMHDLEQEEVRLARKPDIVKTFEVLRAQQDLRTARLRAKAHAERVGTEARAFAELGGPGQAGIDEEQG